MKFAKTALTAAMLLLAMAPDASACISCQGDPNSELVKGAEAGVLLMVIVTYLVVLSFVGCAVLWFVRARQQVRKGEQEA